MNDPTDTPTVHGSLTHAARLLNWAETEDNLPRGELLATCADTWTNIAAVLIDHQDA